jgi:hypothetical protein
MWLAGNWNRRNFDAEERLAVWEEKTQIQTQNSAGRVRTRETVIFLLVGAFGAYPSTLQTPTWLIPAGITARIPRL